jgi:hypothetical protein
MRRVLIPASRRALDRTAGQSDLDRIVSIHQSVSHWGGQTLPAASFVRAGQRAARAKSDPGGSPWGEGGLPRAIAEASASQATASSLSAVKPRRDEDCAQLGRLCALSVGGAL